MIRLGPTVDSPDHLSSFLLHTESLLLLMIILLYTSGLKDTMLRMTVGVSVLEPLMLYEH